MLAHALAHATALPHAHSGGEVAALLGVLVVLVVALAPRALRLVRRSQA
jgi:hypothetical protein